MRLLACLLALSLLGFSAPAHACWGYDLTEIKNAKIVVVGRISNYTKVSEKMARFNLQVDEILRGNIPPTLTVAWKYGAVPESIPSDSYMIPLVHTAENSFEVREWGCAGPNITPNDSDQAREIRQILER